MTKAFLAASTLTGTYLTRVTLLLDPTSITQPILTKTIWFFMMLLRAAMMNQRHQVIQPYHWYWNKHKQRIEHEYSITAWVLCIMGSVRNNVRDRLTGHYRDAIEKVVTCLHVPPCPNPNPDVLTILPHKIIDTFWNELKAFHNCTHPHHNMSRWASSDCVSGKSYLWHEKYSLPYTIVLGYVGCYVRSKLCRIGPVKRSWGGVKQIKDGV
jgi:hypothetical protein